MILRWTRHIAIAVAIAALLGMGLVYSASEAAMRVYPAPPPFTHAIPGDSAAVVRGDHLVRTRGCRGCHGKDLAGQLMWGYAVAPNLPALARSETPATLEAAIRHGIGRDGRAFYAMPSYNFVHLTDADLADMIAYLRTVPVVQKKLPEPALPWNVRLNLATGDDKPVAGFLHLLPPLKHADDRDRRIARGEYIAMTTCNECHGFSLRADIPWPDDHPAPDLVIAGSYAEGDFRHFMRTGKAAGNRELEMMSDVARTRFAYFTDEEVGDLYAFLKKMSDDALTQSAK